jgi:transposase
MDKRVKYSQQEKLSVIHSILAGRESIISAARKIGGHKKSIQRWLGLYRHYGAAGLKTRHGSYTAKFKTQVVKHMLNNHLSLLETAAYFGIPNEQAVGRWLKWYEAEGKAGLHREHRGRKKSLMGRKPKKKGNIPAKSIDEQLAALQSENEYLRAENAFLKKLDALILEEKTAKKQSRQQKPSKN